MRFELNCPGRDSNPGRRLERPAYFRYAWFDRAVRPSGPYTTGASPRPAGSAIRAFALGWREVAPLPEVADERSELGFWQRDFVVEG